jgi:hypothetical protein
VKESELKERSPDSLGARQIVALDCNGVNGQGETYDGN